MSVTETSTLGPKGRIVIPKRFRDELNIAEGDELLFAMSETGLLTVTSRAGLLRELAGAWAGPDRSLVDELFAERRLDSERARQ